MTELQHNRTLPLDRISEAVISSAQGQWQSGLDTLDAEMHILGSLAFAYQSR
ncbi:MAG: hypothetical protein HY785_05480 [Oscillatoriophycideae cyanobacterium NC_groundwater_1537_Pr4_S-0.65um_50_18]|nr:hypothetical protein [Oscillatoriophycideae cyanobacterium NC_groundwater_1537_Pr4_S-0.65um_50_18]